MSVSADTIVAIATAPGQGALGILRLSGPRAWAAAARVARDWPRAAVPRRAWVSRFADAEGQVVDRGLVLLFQAPASATGEDVAELHAHGSRALLELLLQATLAEDGVRRAGPGEFTRRGYLNGRLDLAQAEAVAQLVSAESATQVRAAAAQLEGELGRRLEELRRAVLGLAAGLEGALDFPDEADDALPGLRGELEGAQGLARALQADLERGALLRRGARVVLYGPPNAGKSTLFNRLLGVERALVDEAPGTTRDALEGRVLLEGLPLTWVDTAGLRAGGGRLEAEGMRRTRRELSQADVAVLLLPVTTSQAEVAGWLAEAPAAVGLLAWSRADEAPAEAVQGQEGLRLSGLTGQGVEALRQAVLARLAGSAGAVALASEVHQELVGRAQAALGGAQEAWDVSLEAAAGEVAVALEVLSAARDRDVGRDRLDALFARFCIGK